MSVLRWLYANAEYKGSSALCRGCIQFAHSRDLITVKRANLDCKCARTHTHARKLTCSSLSNTNRRKQKKQITSVIGTRRERCYITQNIAIWIIIMWFILIFLAHTVQFIKGHETLKKMSFYIITHSASVVPMNRKYYPYMYNACVYALSFSWFLVLVEKEDGDSRTHIKNWYLDSISINLIWIFHGQIHMSYIFFTLALVT